MCLGLTLTDNKVTVIFSGEGVYLVSPLTPGAIGYPDVTRHMKTLKEVGCELVAEKESLEMRGLTDPGSTVDVKGRSAIQDLIEQSDRVIGF